MGKVQHFGDSVDHRIAERDQRVDAAQADAGDQVGQKLHSLKHLTLVLPDVTEPQYVQKIQ